MPENTLSKGCMNETDPTGRSPFFPRSIVESLDIPDKILEEEPDEAAIEESILLGFKPASIFLNQIDQPLNFIHYYFTLKDLNKDSPISGISLERLANRASLLRRETQNELNRACGFEPISTERVQYWKIMEDITKRAIEIQKTLIYR